MDQEQKNKKIEELLSRSIDKILPSKDLLKEKLTRGDKLKIYIGADPTGASLHLGHATNYIILEKFRQLGHKVVLLIGDFTARIGDPTDKDTARKQLSRKDVKRNAKTWLSQVGKVLNLKDKKNKVEVVYNHKWLSKMKFEDVITVASNFTVQQMLERDMFENRIKEGKPIYLHEFFYPLMQGYDSVYMNVDIELCGTDQLFNALAGRTLLKRLKDKEKFVITTTLLENPKTGQKMMSKSLGTGIYIDEEPNEMFGKVMSQPDENMRQLFVDTTLLELDEIDKIMAKEPMEAKKNTFQKGKPDQVKEISLAKNKMLIDTLIDNQVVESKNQIRRLLEDGAIKINREKILENTQLKGGEKIQVGKRKWVKVK